MRSFNISFVFFVTHEIIVFYLLLERCVSIRLHFLLLLSILKFPLKILFKISNRLNGSFKLVLLQDGCLIFFVDNFNGRVNEPIEI